ncbi:MAG: hypothetical protein NVV57_04720 [Demequina sp.]|jgi:hypothetical protein|nr:hypothetical protein [Demequina sp.]
MVDNALLAQVMRLDAESRLELRDAIEASVAHELLPSDLAALLAARVAEDDESDHDQYVTLDDLERQTLARRARRGA